MLRVALDRRSFRQHPCGGRRLAPSIFRVLVSITFSDQATPRSHALLGNACSYALRRGVCGAPSFFCWHPEEPIHTSTQSVAICIPKQSVGTRELVFLGLFHEFNQAMQIVQGRPFGLLTKLSALKQVTI